MSRGPPVALHSRPTPEELLGSVIRSLQTRVLPAIDDPVAQEQIGTAITLLGYLSSHWDTATSDLVEEIAAIGALLAEAGRGTPSAGGDLRYSTLTARVDELHEALLALAIESETATNDAGRSLGERARTELAAIQRRRA